MVIQRWQSLLLLVGVVLMGCFTFCSLGQVQTIDSTFSFTSLGFYQETEDCVDINYHTWYFFALSLTTTILVFLDIFLYRSLPLQKRICLVSILFIIFSGAVAATLGYTAIAGGVIVWSTAAICPIIAIVSLIIAYGYMVRDHNRLKAVDRIR